MAQSDRQARLQAAFLGEPAALAGAPAFVGPALVSLYERGREAFSDLVLDEGAFGQFLGERFAPADLAAEVAAIPADDLYLACACTLGAPAAAGLLMARCRGPVQAALARLLPSAAAQEEVMQRLWQHLLVPGGGSAPRIAQYQGRGTLCAFSRAAALRIALSELRKRRPLVAANDELERLADGADDPEMRYLKRLYREEFRRSFARALAGLAPAQQLLLRLEIVERLTIDQIAVVYGRSRTTSGRHLLEARQELARATLADLRSRLSLAPSEVESVAQLVRSQLDLSVQRLLAEDAAE